MGIGLVDRRFDRVVWWWRLVVECDRDKAKFVASMVGFALFESSDAPL